VLQQLSRGKGVRILRAHAVTIEKQQHLSGMEKGTRLAQNILPRKQKFLQGAQAVPEKEKRDEKKKFDEVTGEATHKGLRNRETGTFAESATGVTLKRGPTEQCL